MFQAIIISGIQVSTLWLLLIVGAAGMFLCCNNRRSIFSLTVWQCGVFTALLTAVGVLGAMLLYAAEVGQFGGVSFYGSVYLIPILMPLVGLFFRLKFSQTMDICGPCVAIMIGCLRVNCFLSGCCGGWQVCVGTFCFSWPTQVIDSICDFIILFWLLQLETNRNAKGILYPLFMVAYSAMRFFLEFLRDTPKDWLCLSHGQWFAAGAIVVGAMWILQIKRKAVSDAHIS